MMQDRFEKRKNEQNKDDTTEINLKKEVDLSESTCNLNKLNEILNMDNKLNTPKINTTK
jgi:hypothetical protein